MSAVAEPLWVLKVRCMPDGEIQLSLDNGYWMVPEGAKRLAAHLQIVLDAISTTFNDESDG